MRVDRSGGNISLEIDCDDDGGDNDVQHAACLEAVSPWKLASSRKLFFLYPPPSHNLILIYMLTTAIRWNDDEGQSCDENLPPTRCCPVNAPKVKPARLSQENFLFQPQYFFRRIFFLHSFSVSIFLSQNIFLILFFSLNISFSEYFS